MRNLGLLLLAASLTLCGCTRYYVMRLNNGDPIITIGKPKLKGEDWYYKDTEGNQQRISEGSVSEVEPASMAGREKAPLNPQPLQW